MTILGLETKHRRVALEAHGNWLLGYQKNGDDLFLWLGFLSIVWERP